jgi:TonB family protein
MVWALLLAALTSSVTTSLLRHDDAGTPALSDRLPLPHSVVEFLPPPALTPNTGGQVLPNIRLEQGRMVPIPDAEVVEADVSPFASIGTGSDNGDRVGVAAPGGNDPMGPVAQWVPPQPRAPIVFLVVEVPPQLVSLTIPAYPELAREAGVEGTVHVEVLVGEDGLVLDAAIKQGVPLLNEVALEAAFTAVFRPAQQSGQPVRTLVVLPIEFALR